MKSTIENSYNGCLSVNSVYGEKWTHGIFFLRSPDGAGNSIMAPIRIMHRFPLICTWLHVLGGRIIFIIGWQRFIKKPTSYSPYNSKFSSSTTSSATSSNLSASMHYSKCSSLKNVCLAPSVVNLHYWSKVYSSIGSSPLLEYWWVKMMQDASFWSIFFISRQRKPVFSSLWALFMSGYFFLMCFDVCVVRHNTITIDTFPIVIFYKSYFFTSKNNCTLGSHKQMTTFPCSFFYTFKGRLLQYLPSIL